jgi:hypothetical protein
MKLQNDLYVRRFSREDRLHVVMLPPARAPAASFFVEDAVFQIVDKRHPGEGSWLSPIFANYAPERKESFEAEGQVQSILKKRAFLECRENKK